MQKIRFLVALTCVGFALRASGQRLPADTHLSVRLDRTVTSRRAYVGERVPASLAEDVAVNGRVVARRGAHVQAVVTYVKHSGRFHHAGYLTIRLVSIDLRRRRYSLHSSAIRDKGNGHLRSNTEKIGGGAGLGAVIGALAGRRQGCAARRIAWGRGRYGCGSSDGTTTRGVQGRIRSRVYAHGSRAPFRAPLSMMCVGTELWRVS